MCVCVCVKCAHYYSIRWHSLNAKLFKYDVNPKSWHEPSENEIGAIAGAVDAAAVNIF